MDARDLIFFYRPPRSGIANKFFSLLGLKCLFPYFLIYRNHKTGCVSPALPKILTCQSCWNLKKAFLPDFRRWTAFAGMTNSMKFRLFTSSSKLVLILYSFPQR